MGKKHLLFWIAGPVLAGWTVAGYGAIAVIRSAYENPLIPLADEAIHSNLVCYGVAGNVGGFNLHSNNWQSALVENLDRFVVSEVQVGAPCGAVVANYGLGDQLPPPDGVAEGAVPVFNAGNLVWLDYAGKLLAVDSGAAVVQWVMDDGSIMTTTYVISPDPKVRPVRLYWTDDEAGNPLQNAGPTVQFGQNYRVDLYASSSVAINEDNYQWNNSSYSLTNNVWLTGSLLHAKSGTEGKFLLTYSRLDENGFRQYLGHEVVEVLSPMSGLQQVHVGDRLTPVKRKYEISDLFSTISRGATDPTGENPEDIYVYKHNQGAKNGWIWAIRETESAWQVEIYWKAKEKLDVIWPFEVDIYDISWGTDMQQFVRGDLAAADFEPAVYIPDELVVEVMPYQTRAGESGSSSAFAFVEDSELRTEDFGKFLLRYSTEDTVWFEPVEAVSHVDIRGAVQPQEIATRLLPQSGNEDLSIWPGYCYTPTGTAYNPDYYSYPEQYVDPEDITSSIYGVNRGELEVWWANASRFWTLNGTESGEVKLPEPVYFPSVVNLYTNVWPQRARELVVASGRGSEVDVGYANHGAMVDPDLSGYLDVNTINGITYEGWIKVFLEDESVRLFCILNLNELCLKDNIFDVSGPGLESGSLGITNKIPANTWTHLAMLQKPVPGTNLLEIALFINGEQISLNRITNNIPSGFRNQLCIGSSQFAGVMDEVRFWESALTPEQIRDSYEHRWTLPRLDDPLVWCRFEPADPLLNEGVADVVLTGTGSSEIIIPDYDVSPDGFSLAGTSPEIYFENSMAQTGYNPNEEHALVIQEKVYALRSDLNRTNAADYTSDPYVLVEYEDKDGIPDMAIFKVVTETERFPFAQSIEAGQMIQAPPPLNQLVPTWCANNLFVAGPLNPFKDRTGRFWAQRAGDDGGTVNAVAHLWYPSQIGFWYPDEESYEVGEEVPFSAGIGSGPVDYTYTVFWPEEVPEIYVGDTLTNPKNGLPAVRGQLSVDVVYQQSMALSSNTMPSVKLIDPTSSRRTGMTEVPETMKTYYDRQTGYTLFSELPPALRSRMYWNGTAAESERFQLIGEYVERTDGYNYLLLNTLSGSNRENALDTDIVTGQDQVWIDAVADMPGNVLEIVSDETPVDSYALSTVGKGQGYVTLVFNNSTNEVMVDSSENVDMEIIKVAPELYQGRLDALFSPNPLDRQMTLKYTADFAGAPEYFEFEWNYADPDNGSAPDESSSNWKYFAQTNGLHYTTVGDAGVFGLSDHYLRCRYRALDPDVQSIVGTNWAAWTPPQLCEGWIKRAMKQINPFEQRIHDYMNYEIDTSLSMIQQAGRPYSGDVPLNYDALDDYGLIPIYETIYRQSLDLCANEDVSGALSLALMMVSGRLADFYTLLGNEAYADALNPTVTLGSDDPEDMTEFSSIFCFQNQLPDLLSEELALLRGRDGSTNPDVTEYPLYNRLPWNFTADIIGGEVAYVLNYGISDLKGDQDGSLDADDAAILYPQGHGDAWGHYLTALNYYYSMMHQPNFHWYPQVEGLLVGDSEVTVSYLHEKKFAVAAAAKARAGLDILNKTWRQDFEVGRDDNWDALYDSNTNREWGVSEWAVRTGQGCYFDWLAGNSLLPDRDSDPEHEGIRVIDRVTVPELAEIAESGRKVQQQLDSIDADLNPLGLAENVVPFDISAAGIDSGETHFEQIYNRAEIALQNAASIFDRVQSCAQALRDQNEDRTFDQTLDDEEAELNRRLIEIYGYPYSDDIGTGKLYPQDYSGPDLVHYNYIEQYTENGEPIGSISVVSTNYTVEGYERTEQYLNDLPWEFSSFTYPLLLSATLFEVDKPVVKTECFTYEFSVNAAGLTVKPDYYTGTRRAEGTIQIALSGYVEAFNRLQTAVTVAQRGGVDVENLAERIYINHSYEMTLAVYSTEVDTIKNSLKVIRDYLKTARETAAALADDTWRVQMAIADAAPTAVGLSYDAGSPLRMLAASTGGGIMISKQTTALTMNTMDKVMLVTETALDLTQSLVTKMIERQQLHEQELWELQDLVRKQKEILSVVYEMSQAAETACMEYKQTVAKGDALQLERERLRLNHASDLNAKRYRNMAYQIFRNDELQRYSETFDQAARYCYLAAKAYDYETGLLQSEDGLSSGSDFMEQIVKARAIGRMRRGAGNEPETPLVGGPAGDPGLADILARMKANWDVLDGRLSFNNPQTETGRFSLRSELFRIKPTEVGGDSSDENWRGTLENYRVDNLLDIPEFKRFCLPFTPQEMTEPAIVIPFSTDISFRHNFFGLDLAGGDNAYDSTHFATKIRSAGVWFSNFDNAFESGLANQPRVYLIPAGIDRMRVPSADMDEIRNFQVVDQAMPVPYPFSEQDWDSPDWSALKDMLGNELYEIRRYPSMRAYHDSGDFDATEVVNNSRLIGRSVWNTKWLLIIPGGTLLADAEEGLDRFIHGREIYPGLRDENGVKDIKIFFQTYSYSGN